jgi:hypothetical protein
MKAESAFGSAVTQGVGPCLIYAERQATSCVIMVDGVSLNRQISQVGSAFSASGGCSVLMYSITAFSAVRSSSRGITARIQPQCVKILTHFYATAR